VYQIGKGSLLCLTIVKKKVRNNELMKIKKSIFFFTLSKEMNEQKSMDANTLMNVQNAVGGDVSKTLTTVDVLASLKAMNDFAEGDDRLTIKAIADNELSYLKSAMKAINDNQLLSLKFGNGLEGAMTVAGLLKQRNAERTYTKVLDAYAQDSMGRELESLIKGSSSAVNFKST